MERCWDDDADARLTSHCVEQRIKKLVYSPTDNTFDSQLLHQLKEHHQKEDSVDSSISCHSALIVGGWDDNSSNKKTSSASSTKSLASTTQMENVSRCSKSSRSDSSLSQSRVNETTEV